MAAWQRLIRAQFGLDPLLITETPPPPPDPALVALGLEIIQGWGAPEPAVIVTDQPLPPPSLDFQTTTVYVWSSTSNPNKSIRATANAVAGNPYGIVADLQDAWIKMGG
jgi:hypothetical protein